MCLQVFLKTLREVIEHIFFGNEFQSLGAATPNDRRPADASLQGGSKSRWRSRYLWQRPGSYDTKSSRRCFGPALCRVVNTIISTLCSTRCSTGSQCRLCRIGVICSFLGGRITNWAASFWIFCRRFMWTAGIFTCKILF